MDLKRMVLKVEARPVVIQEETVEPDPVETKKEPGVTKQEELPSMVLKLKRRARIEAQRKREEQRRQDARDKARDDALAARGRWRRSQQGHRGESQEGHQGSSARKERQERSEEEKQVECIEQVCCKQAREIILNLRFPNYNPTLAILFSTKDLAVMAEFK